MYYEVFPFGKYKGVKLTELPSTYIVLALEKFELPDELSDSIFKILIGRFKVFSKFKTLTNDLSKKQINSFLELRINEFEK